MIFRDHKYKSYIANTSSIAQLADFLVVKSVHSCSTTCSALYFLNLFYELMDIFFVLVGNVTIDSEVYVGFCRLSLSKFENIHEGMSIRVSIGKTFNCVSDATLDIALLRGRSQPQVLRKIPLAEYVRWHPCLDGQ